MNTLTKDTDLQLLETILRAGSWRKAREIANTPLWRDAHPEMSLSYAEREIRAIASESRGAILSYPGSPGYLLRKFATDEEVRTAVNKLRHQARDMELRANQIENFWENPQLPFE